MPCPVCTGALISTAAQTIGLASIVKHLKTKKKPKSKNKSKNK